MSRSFRWARWLCRIATHDFFPILSVKLRRWLYTPLGVLTSAAVVALICGLVLHPRVFVLFAGLLAVIAVGTGWPWLTIRGVRGSLGFDCERCTEGESIDIWLTVTNYWPWPAWGLVLRGVCASRFKEVDDSIRILKTPGRTQTTYRWTFTPPRRGEYPLATPWLTTQFPLGVWEAKRRVVVQKRLVVWPKTYPVGPVPPGSEEVDCGEHTVRNRIGNGGDIIGVRPYRQGDSSRRIHWSQTARHNQLIVCEWQAVTRPAIQLILDVHPAVHVASSGNDGSREWAIRIAASFTQGWLQAGAQVGLVTHGAIFPPAAGAEQSHRILDALARLPEDSFTTLSQLLELPCCRYFRHGLQLVITTDRTEICDNTPAGLDRRWIILRCAGFEYLFATAAALLFCNWRENGAHTRYTRPIAR